MAGLGDGVAEDAVDNVGRQPQENRQRPIGRFFAPLAEQMKDEEQGIGVGRPFQRQEIIERAQEGWDHRFAIGPGSADRRDRQPLRVA